MGAHSIRSNMTKILIMDVPPNIQRDPLKWEFYEALKKYYTVLPIDDFNIPLQPILEAFKPDYIITGLARHITNLAECYKYVNLSLIHI